MRDARDPYIQPIGDVVKEVLPAIEAIAQRALANPKPEPTAEELEAAERSEWYDAAARIGIWTRFLDAKLETAKATSALEAVKQYDLEGFDRGQCLVLMGPPSVGKSYAAVAALRARRGVRRGWWYFPDLVKFGDEGDTARAQAKTVRYAVFDDFGAEYVKKGGPFEAHIDALFAHRHGNMLPTIVTTNMVGDDFLAVSERLVERLREWGVLVSCLGQNLRRESL